MNIYDLISRAQKLRQETKIDSVSPDRVGALCEDTLKYINEFQLLVSSPSLHKIYASVSAMQADKSPKSDLTGKALKPGQLVVIVPANQSDATAGDVYRYDGPSGNTSAWTFVSKIGAVPADAELNATSENPVQNKVVTEKLTELESEANRTQKYSQYPEINGWVDGSNKFVLDYGSHKVIKVKSGTTLKITGVVSIFILKTYTKPTPSTLEPDFATGTDGRIVVNGTLEMDLPNDANYIVLNYKLTSSGAIQPINELIVGDWDYLTGTSANVWQIIRNYNPIWRIGNISISLSGWTWDDDANRVCVISPIRMKKGDKIYLLDYSNARMYVGWRLDDGTYKRQGWITSGVFICPDNGDYVINMSNLTEAAQSSFENLANLVVLINTDKFAADATAEEMSEYWNLWKVRNIRIEDNSPWEWTDDNTRVSTSFPIKLSVGQTIELASYTDTKLYIGWKDVNGTYHGIGWITSGKYIVQQDGWYVFNIASVNGTVQDTPYNFAKLLVVGTTEKYEKTTPTLVAGTTTASNQGRIRASIIVLDDYTGDYYSSVFNSTSISSGGRIFFLFRKDNGKIYIRIGDTVTTLDQTIEVGKKYEIDVEWNNGSYTIKVNDETKTGTYTTAINCSLWFGLGDSDTKCVSAVVESITINSVPVAISTGSYIPVSDFVAKTNNYLQEQTKGFRKLYEDINGLPKTTYNPLVNKPFYAHYRVDQFMKDGEGHNVVANGSLDEIKCAARLGFDFVEIKPKVTADGYYINMHGSAGNFADNVYALNGDNLQEIAINSKTLSYIKENVRYNSYIEKYRTQVPTLQETLICCKEYNIGAFVEATNNDIVNICRQYLDDSSLILYSPQTNVRKTLGFQGLIFHWFNNASITKDVVVESANTYGTPFIAGIGQNTISGLGDSGLKELIKALHDNNCLAGFASHGLDLQKYFRFGGDACAADYEVNPFESNYEVFDINGDASQFNTTGILATGICALEDGQQISCGSATTIPLGKAALKLRFVGEVNISFGTLSVSGVTSDGSDVYFDSTYLLDSNTRVTITSVGNTIITDLLYKTSKC